MKLLRHLLAIGLLPFVVTVVIPACMIRASSTLHTGWDLPSPLGLLPTLLGCALVGLGVLLVCKTVILFATVGEGTLAPWDPPRRLVVRGPYRHVRNPMISGVLSILLGEAMLFGSVPLLVWFLVLFALNALSMPLIEEPLLESRFGSDYVTYKRNVPRWIPRVKPWTVAVEGPMSLEKGRSALQSCFAEPLGKRVAILCLVRGVGRSSPLMWEPKRGAGRLLKILRISKHEPRNGGDNVVNEPKANDPMSDGDPGTARRTAPKGQRNDYFATPLGSLSSGHLLFASGTSNVTIHADPSMEDLYRARFEDQVPIVRVQGGTIIIEYPPFPSLDQRYYWLERPAEVTLNASVTWHIESRGSTSRLTANLCKLRLGSIKLVGGASRTEIMLPRPSATVSVHILGGASNVTIHRPEGVAARTHVVGGATNLTFDEKHLGAIGGDVNLQSPDYDDATNRYDFEVTGGANNLTIDAR